jgi:hypothetical protein
MPFTSLSRDAGTALQMNRGTCRLFELQKYCDHDMKSESPVDAPECPLAFQRPGCQPTPAAPAQANLEKAATTLNETRIPRAGSGGDSVNNLHMNSNAIQFSKQRCSYCYTTGYR